MPTTGFTTTWTKSNLKSTKVDESIYPKKMIDGQILSDRMEILQLIFMKAFVEREYDSV